MTALFPTSSSIKQNRHLSAGSWRGRREQRACEVVVAGVERTETGGKLPNEKRFKPPTNND
jgi:hypothetical protein